MDMDKPKIGIIGSGTMGREIATFLIENQYPILFKARKEADIETFLASAEKSRKKLLRQRKITETDLEYLRANTVGTTVFDNRLADLDIVIETIVEDFEVKRSLFNQLEEVCSEEATICTNTSSLSVTDLAEGMKKKDRFLGLHFFQPFRAFKFIELIPAAHTSTASLAIIRRFIKSIKKNPFTVKDSPGFFFNRVQLTNMLEVFLALESGWHGVDELNQAFKESQFYLGVLGSADKLGVDLLEDAILNFHKSWSERWPVPKITQLMRAKKRYGEKAGKGFYSYEVKPPVIDDEMQSIMDDYKAKRSPKAYGFTPEIGIHRIMNEGISCLEEGIADIDEAEDAMCSVSPFLFIKGFYRAMDEMGLDVLYNALLEHEKNFGARYRPAQLLKNMVDKGELGVKTGKGFFQY